jgi:ADP-ribose pyrophosphatase YjhB (NUDIX family)
MCLFYRDGKILVSRGQNKITHEVFYRLLGGSLHFGENSETGIRREIEEELHSEIENLQFVTTIENTFTHEDWQGHEIVFMYIGDLKRKELYEQKVIHIVEETYEFDAEWIPVRDVMKGTKTLFPTFDWKSLFQKMRDNFGAKDHALFVDTSKPKAPLSSVHKDLVKKAKAEGEHAKVSIRTARKDGNEEVRKIKTLTQDEVKGAETKIQELTDSYIIKVDKHLEAKEKEISLFRASIEKIIIIA